MAKIAIEIDDLGNLLRDVVAAYLKQGNPSVLLKHIHRGVSAHIRDLRGGDKAEDEAMARKLGAALCELETDFREGEGY